MFNGNPIAIAHSLYSVPLPYSDQAPGRLTHLHPLTRLLTAPPSLTYTNMKSTAQRTQSNRYRTGHLIPPLPPSPNMTFTPQLT